MKTVKKIINVIGTVSEGLIGLGVGTGMVLCGLRYIRIVGDEHDYLKFW